MNIFVKITVSDSTDNRDKYEKIKEGKLYVFMSTLNVLRPHHRCYVFSIPNFVFKISIKIYNMDFFNIETLASNDVDDLIDQMAKRRLAIKKLEVNFHW